MNFVNFKINSQLDYEKSRLDRATSLLLAVFNFRRLTFSSLGHLKFWGL